MQIPNGDRNRETLKGATMSSDSSEKSLSRREFLNRAEMGVAGACLALSGMTNSTAASNKRPNIIFILQDDQRYDAIGCLGNPPWLKTPNMDRLVHNGLLFKNAFCANSLCAPSRSSFLTGKYAHKTGVVDNFKDFPAENIVFPLLLQKAGYETAFIGKWHMGQMNGPQPGFNKWVGFVGQGVYFDPVLNVDGKDGKYTGYLTDLLTDHAVGFMKQRREKPFCLYLCHKAVHDFRDPAPRHAKLYANENYPLPPNARYDMEGKPKCVRERSDLMKGQVPFKTMDDWQAYTRKYYQCLAAVDDSVGRILKTLDEMGERENTIIVLAGDNGYFLGEHGLWDKRFAYEPSMRIPMAVYHPKMIKPGTVRDEMVLNVDLAPSMLDVADVPIPSYMQGRSFKPLLEGKKTPWREDFLYHYHIEIDLSKMTPQERADFDRKWRSQGLDPSPLLVPENLAVRTKEWKYITYPGIKETDELYNLTSDPYEMKNRISDPKCADVVRRMKTRLTQLVEETK
jgi:N-acetylglucosamine-6-sulfatase